MDRGVVTLNWEHLGRINDLGKDYEKPFPFPTKQGRKGLYVKDVRGIYVWILPEKDNKNTVFYVGQSEHIWKRLEQEIIDLLGGAWNSYELPGNGFTDFLKITYCKGTSEINNDNCYCGVKDRHYSPNRGQISCIAALLDGKRIKWAMDMLNVLEIAIAPLSDVKILEEIETALISNLRRNAKIDQYPSFIQTAFFGGISKKPDPEKELKIVHAGDIGKMPGEIIKVSSYPII